MLIKETNGRFRIVLALSEAERLGLAGIWGGETPGADMLCRLLLIAAAVKNAPILKADYSVEIYMLRGGGCEVCFSPCRVRIKPKRREKSAFFVTEFTGPDPMLAAVEAVFAKHPDAGGGLYAKDGRYRLVMGSDAKTGIRAILCRFGSPVVSAAAAGHTCEYWDPVCPESAVGTVGAALSAVRRG